jgi:RNA polymerase sigma-70 factor (ECF subfamily)
VREDARQRPDDDGVVAAARAGDESAFTTLVERYRGELRVHCYRMLGSFDESEDLVQETFLRAWKNLRGFEGRSTFRAWLYRIATNACLDALDGQARRVLPHHLAPPSDPGAGLPPRTDIAWLQPLPDRLWEPVAPSEDEPDAVVVTRETIELAFLAAIQHLPPRQRAVLILRDVLGWPAKQTAALLEGSVASVNSALQRARATLREHLPERRLEWAPSAEATEQERALLRRYMDAVERADLAAVAGLLAEDVRTTMPPYPMWFQGRDAVVAALTASWDAGSPGYVGRFQMVPTRANRQPAVAAYVRGLDEPAYRAFAIAVLRIEDGRIVEVTAFHEPGLFPAFALPAALPPTHR